MFQPEKFKGESGEEITPANEEKVNKDFALNQAFARIKTLFPERHKNQKFEDFSEGDQDSFVILRASGRNIPTAVDEFITKVTMENKDFSDRVKKKRKEMVDAKGKTPEKRAA